jgi:maltose-binding protein MalE
VTPALAAGTAPDIKLRRYAHARNVAASGQIVNIQPYLDARGFDQSQFMDFMVEGCTYDINLYGIPLIRNTHALL